MLHSLRGRRTPREGQDRATCPPSRVEGQLPQNLTLSKGEEALHVGKQPGGRRADLLDLLLVGLALFCLGILLSFLATATTTEVFSAPAGKALGDVDGEALVRLDKDATSAPLSTPAAQEARQTEESPLRASLLTMLVVAISSFFWRSGLSLLARNCSLKGGVSHSLGLLLGGWWAAGCGGASLLGVFLL